MGSANSSLALGEFDALTRSYVDESEVYDQVFETSNTLKRLKEIGVIRTGKVLPTDYGWRVRYDLPTEAQAVSSFTVVDLPADDLFEGANLKAKTYVEPISLPLDKVEANLESPERIANLVQEEVEAAIEAFAAKMNKDFFSDGTNPLQIVGTRSAIGVDREYANIDSTSYSWWDCVIVNSSTYGSYTATELKDSTSAYYIGDLLTKAIALLEQKRLAPENYFCVCTPAFAQAYRLATKDFLQIQMAGLSSVDLAARKLFFDSVPIISDIDCPATASGVSHNYLFHKKYVHWEFGKMYDEGEKKMGLFNWTGWKDQRPTQRTIAGSLEVRTVLAFKRPGAMMDLQCDGSTVGTISA